ncbi:hypothetical protein HYDPIDRAFT_113313 [Hydnomerulius pinastri MD-312]|uniref:Calcipressin n=1 Tax=Hydnomerulius pinastri MD-312 TaxID=994086 RepID=A0A0C9WEH4_9AGAM|nr:hypothetical protein HYDPIDRAFT_113313 [Hydnomerulius pinastri MD-312]
MPSAVHIHTVDLPSQSLTKGHQPTNSLLITQVPRSFFQPVILEALRDYFAVYGEINQWVPLSFFSRIIVVYYNEDSAEQAKCNCDPLIIQPTHATPTTLRVFRADSMPLSSPSSVTSDEHYLKPPPLEKNFLISPPGSPPVGWEPIREDPPNTATLAEDLVTALKKLQLRGKRGSREVLLEPEDGVGVGVYVEDADGYDSDGDGEGDDQEMDWDYGTPSPARLRWKPMPTAMPPMSMTLR